WDRLIDFTMQPIAWEVQYFTDTELQSFAGSTTVNDLKDVIAARPESLGSTTYSLRAQRTLDLPAGEYRYPVCTDDGMRLKLNGQTMLDAWRNQPATGYSVDYEHQGGSLALEVEYYQAYGSATLELEFKPVGFFAEYYKGTVLNQGVEGGLDRT